VYLFGFPQSVYADIRTREHSLVDDWIDILLYYPITSALKSWFCSGSDPAYTIHGKVFPETAGRCTRRRFEIGKNQIWTVGEQVY
jgi:hypothetical protein